MSLVTSLFDRPQCGRSVIASGTTVRGTIDGLAELVVAGVIEGDVTAGAVTVEVGGRIRGDVIAEVLHVKGRVDGHCAVDALAVAATGQVTGSASYTCLEVESGARFDVQCRAQTPDAPHRREIAAAKSPRLSVAKSAPAASGILEPA